MKNKNQEFVDILLDWFKTNKRNFLWRNPELTPFKILLAEIMLQKTGANQVEKLFPDFIEKYPTAQDIVKISDLELENLLRPLGLYQRRARDIKKTAQLIADNNDIIPNTRKELMDLPGVGDYIANAVLCFAFKQRVPIVDANVGRVINRVFSFPVKNAPSRDKKLLEKMKEIIPEKNYIEFNYAILDFAALVCMPRNPLCDDCPILEICDFT